MTPLLPPDYAAHDAAYAKLRAHGATGWNADDSDTYFEMLSAVAPALSPATGTSASRVLEIGCGAGNFSLLLAQQGYAVTGVDIAPSAIQWANERGSTTPNAPVFRVDNVLELATCGDATFDAVIDGHCLHCIIGADRGRCLSAVRRVLRPGGIFVVMTMCGEVLNPRVLEVFDPANQVTLQANRPARYMGSAPAILAEIANAGFTVEMQRIDPRKDADDMDTLIVYARLPG